MAKYHVTFSIPYPHNTTPFFEASDRITGLIARTGDRTESGRAGHYNSWVRIITDDLEMLLKQLLQEVDLAADFSFTVKSV